MANFQSLIPTLKKLEGGLSKNPNDSASSFPVPDGSGYHTNKGITYRTFVNSASKYGYVATPKLFYEMPDNIWGAIFKGEYWDVIQGDKIKSTGVAYFICDWGFNAGPNTAVRQVQEVLNVTYKLGLKVDGVMGTNTLANTNAVAPATMLQLLQAKRVAFYNNLVKQNPSQQTFLQGWIARSNQALAFAQQNLLPTAGSLLGAALFFLERINFLHI